MGMTINEALYCMTNGLCIDCKYYNNQDKPNPYYWGEADCEKSEEAETICKDIFEKYQRIQEQVELAESENHVVDTARMIMIEKIINGE